MFESKDILNYSLTLAVIVLTFFISWLLYYTVSIIGDVRKVTKEILGTIQKLGHILDEMKEKLSHFTALLPVVLKGMEKVVSVVRQKKQTRKRTSKSTSEDV